MVNKLFNYATLFLFALIISFLLYRIMFYLLLGQPLEMGNLPETAPKAFRTIKMAISVPLIFTPFILPVYLFIFIFQLKENPFLSKYSLAFLSVIILYLLFWFLPDGATWLYW